MGLGSPVALRPLLPGVAPLQGPASGRLLFLKSGLCCPLGPPAGSVPVSVKPHNPPEVCLCAQAGPGVW